MTREEMIRQIVRFAEKCGPFSDPECWDKDARLTEWVEEAPQGWFDVLMNVITNPPDWVQYEKEHKLWLEDGWDEFQYPYLIGDGISQDVECRLPIVGPLLSRSDTRLLILRSFAWISSTSQMIFWLKPMVENVFTLSDDEQIALARAIGHIQTDESLEMLIHMRDVIPKSAVSVQKNINAYLPLPYFVPMQTLEEGNNAND